MLRAVALRNGEAVSRLVRRVSGIVRAAGSPRIDDLGSRRGTGRAKNRSGRHRRGCREGTFVARRIAGHEVGRSREISLA